MLYSALALLAYDSCSSTLLNLTVYLQLNTASYTALPGIRPVGIAISVALCCWTYCSTYIPALFTFYKVLGLL